MSNIKIKLRKNEFIAVFNSMKLINIDMFSSSLETKAKQELLQKIYLRMGKNMFDLKKENSFTLSLPEAWAFYCEIPKTISMVGSYEAVVLQDIINTIHQKTI